MEKQKKRASRTVWSDSLFKSHEHNRTWPIWYFCIMENELSTSKLAYSKSVF